MPAKISNVFSRIVNFMAYVSAALIAFAFVSVCAEVIARYVFNTSISWVMETAEYILMFVTFVAAAWVLKKEGHVSVDIVVNLLNARKRAAVNTITSIVGVAISLIIMWYSAGSTWYHFQGGTTMSEKTIDIVLWPLMTVLPIGFFVLSIQFMWRAHGYYQSWRNLPEEELPREEKGRIAEEASDIS